MRYKRKRTQNQTKPNRRQTLYPILFAALAVISFSRSGNRTNTGSGSDKIYAEAGSVESVPVSQSAHSSSATASETPENTSTQASDLSSKETDLSSESIPVIPSQEAAKFAAITPDQPQSAGLRIEFFDIGQGDSALLTCDGASMLIDGGPKKASGYIYSALKQRGITKLDYLIATHAHEDHIGGLAAAPHIADIGRAFSPVTEDSTKAFRDLVKALREKNVELEVPAAGDTFPLGGASVKVLGPIETDAENKNNTSLVLRVTYGDTRFLFTGDAEREEEDTILNSGRSIQADVLKVGHHGSSSSTSYLWLRTVDPTYAVISCGKNNSYGHPHDEVTSRLRDADTTCFRTDQCGTVTCVSDGTNITFTTEKTAKK